MSAAACAMPCATGVALSALRSELDRRDELVARACHELRGPLAAAQLALQTSLRHPRAPAEQLTAIDLELRRAALALDDLAAARAGGRSPDRRELVDVGRLVRQQASTWQAIAPSFGSRLSLRQVGGRTVVHADPVRLAQAVGNLVANALEHGTGCVDLLVRRLGDRVRVEVADEGTGLPAPLAELRREAATGHGEHGHGLAIAAEIAERHGGRLVGAPSVRGARLALELPAAPDAR